MHGLGNDYIYLDGVSTKLDEVSIDWSRLAAEMSDRHRGVGSDGIIMICPASASSGGHVRMRMWNADGSEGAMCGNGVRCVAAYARQRLGMCDEVLRIEVGIETSGLRQVAVRVLEGDGASVYQVDMGPPRSLMGGVVDRAACARGLIAEGVKVEADLISMGNPHAVLWQWPEGLSGAKAAEKLGPVLEHDAARLEGLSVNVHFARVLSRRSARMWTWERGSGVTQACGTGACSVLVSGVLRGVLDREAKIELPGGTLTIAWPSEAASVMMTGPAEEAFSGLWTRALPRVSALRAREG